MRKALLSVSACLLLAGCSAGGPTAHQEPQAAAPAVQPKVDGHAPSVTAGGRAQPALPPRTSAPAANRIPPSRYTINPTNYRIVNPAQPNDKVLLLTFDDGPTGEATRQLLDILDRHHAKSIWFVNGYQLGTKNKDGSYAIHPDKAALLKEIRQRGHLVGNHTWWHENLRQLPPEKQQEEILSTSRIIEEILGEKPAYFRPPYGAYTETSLAVCREQGMQSVNWSVGSLDWEASVYKQPNGITRQVLHTVHQGGNILFHDRVWTARELDALLTQLSNEGYHYVLPTEAP
ncbi:polysaccharide deacetylase family protein [Brevibacillus sp. SYP-B805]|uniref:polysaccharide deacetylase family protein n=1 Tax=Brevibacillus sp. SYP-B805 TaxID=1578199 RepID=UPI0013EC186C|nr:polysaccharide deacetylase family protein [Brevibacillus sp. SYP-B805]NGQ94608.1 polysaccharide deacetylase family protein [Brevibacillus sp. SYP-B805]